MSFVFVDCEAFGPCPALGVMTELGAAARSRAGTVVTFHGTLLHVSSRADNPAIPDVDFTTYDRVIYAARRAAVFREFADWLQVLGKDRSIFVSDNPAYDWQWINEGFWLTLGRNPFGHSARRIGDFAAGLSGDVSKTSDWKRLRRAPHDHNPVNDALGNLQAFERLLGGER